MAQHDATGARRFLATALMAAIASIAPTRAMAVDSSAPAILQMFEAEWGMIENRMADIHNIGYGRMWVPPPNQASGGLSVGYDVFDRFSFGEPRNETRYGTATGFKAMIDAAHKAGVGINPDLLWNHNGVGNRNDQNFVNLGGYPGFALTLPFDINGDFHDPFIDFTQDEIFGQLAGLNDIGQEKDYQFIRHPTQIGNPNNIPAGTLFNIPDPNNARFYPDQDLGGIQVTDGRGNPATLYSFNADNPLAGDPVLENSVDLLMRNVRWMIQEFDVDGFRLDAARHFEREYLADFDTASFLAKRTPLLDGSPNHVYSFIETGFDSESFLQGFIRRDIDNNNLGTVGGNRDALDFRLFNGLKDNLTGNGQANNWHEIRSRPMDLNDDGLMNGSQGVAFTQSHDETGAFLENVAHAYTLMLPGNALVYLNAEMDGPTGTFPQPGKVDALGGAFGDTVTTLVGLRNTHGRGDFRERWIDDAFNPNGFSNIYVYERSQSAIVGLNSRNDAVALTRNGVQTDFAPGTILVELTGNAADPTVDPGGTIPDSVTVDGNGQINITVPANQGHGRGYVIYGVAAPEGSLSVTSTGVLAGENSTAQNFGTARIADIEVITDPTFTVQLNTNAVSLPNPNGAGTVRDVHADGDTALFSIDAGVGADGLGLDLNGNGVVDNVTPGSVSYGFEEFVTTSDPGYQWDGSQNVGDGTGLYEQVIDTTKLSEGRHYLTVRAFRHRNSATGGDGGPAVFTDFKKTIYVDLLAPESEVASFDPFASDPNNPDNRDLIISSLDQTADRVHVFLDLPANMTDAEILALVNSNQGQAGFYDRDQFIAGQFGVTSGNHAVTIVTIEETGTTNVQRQAGVFTDTNIGAGIGDLNFDGNINGADLTGPVGFEQLLYSQNDQFSAAGDANGDGFVDNLDLFEIQDDILSGATDPRVAERLEEVLERRGDVNEDDSTDRADVAAVLAGVGSDAWLLDIDGDGIVETEDANLLITDLVRTVESDLDLNGRVSAADFALFRSAGASTIGDADLDGDTDANDYDAWVAGFGFERQALTLTSAVSAATTVPEPHSAVLALTALTLARRRVRAA